MAKGKPREVRLPTDAFIEAMSELGRELGREIGEGLEKGLKEIGERFEIGLKEVAHGFETGFKEVAQGLAAGPRAQLYVMCRLQGKPWDECEDTVAKATLLATIPNDNERRRLIEEWKK